ncbi:hypothetical protein Fcan01_05539 [Folsomia candida]|uniref:Beta-1,4-glucuronyltransferase 1 n=1 Tax=Folsomia candida TaxID=158441 RepID=A0A226ESP5_FOLCA|nr:hypothetical protein Fcan01_05539 [Folsomia candida]
MQEVLLERLFHDDEGSTIVDSTGEYRVVFDIAGPQRESILSQSQLSPQTQPQQPNPVAAAAAAVEKPALLPGNANNDDFSIDEDVTDQEPPPSEDLTLVTHGDLMTTKKYLIPLVDRWNGPVSLVLFATNSSNVEAVLELIAHLRFCSDVVRQYVNFHVVFPLVETHVRYSAASSSGKRPINKTGLDKNKRIGSGGNGASKNRRSSTPSKNNNNSAVSAIDFETECQYFQDQREGSKLYKNFRESSDPLLDLGSGGGAATGGSSVMVSTTSFVMNGPQYPINLLRNVARKRVLTDYSLVIPLYLQPSEGLRSKFHKMVKRRKDLDEKTVFVIPSFESKNNETPRNKADLLKLLHSYQARPYHFELCWKCQVHSDYESWGHEAGKDDELSVMYEVLWKDPWEPFFISDNTVPLFDEGFRHPSLDRLSQLCELHVAGYKFAVLNEPFLIHPGYITPTPFHLNSFNKNTNSNLDTNRAKFRQFKHELKNRYPHSTRRCY